MQNKSEGVKTIGLSNQMQIWRVTSLNHKGSIKQEDTGRRGAYVRGRDPGRES